MKLVYKNILFKIRFVSYISVKASPERVHPIPEHDFIVGFVIGYFDDFTIRICNVFYIVALLSYFICEIGKLFITKKHPKRRG